MTSALKPPQAPAIGSQPTGDEGNAPMGRDDLATGDSGAAGKAVAGAPRFCQPDAAAGSAAELLSRAEVASSFLKKLANRDRLMVVCALVDSELSVRGLEDRLGIRQPGLSQQLSELRSAGIILGRKEGKHIFYRLADPKAEELVATLCRLFCA